MKISKYLNDHKENLKVNLVNISSAGISTKFDDFNASN